jgi:hypothetical protein
MFHVKHCQPNWRKNGPITFGGLRNRKRGGLLPTGGTVGRLGGTPRRVSVLGVLPGCDQQLAQAVAL